MALQVQSSSVSSQSYVGPEQYAFPDTKLLVHSEHSLPSDGLAATNSAMLMSDDKQIVAQHSPSTDTWHLPHFVVVPSALVALFDGSIGNDV